MIAGSSWNPVGSSNPGSCYDLVGSSCYVKGLDRRGSWVEGSRGQAGNLGDGLILQCPALATFALAKLGI